MPSLLLVVFLLQLLIYVINTVGAATIDQLVRTPPCHTSSRSDGITVMGALQ